MSIFSALEAPYGLFGVHQEDTTTVTTLLKPDRLTARYDESLGGGEQYAGPSGFYSGIVGNHSTYQQRFIIAQSISAINISKLHSVQNYERKIYPSSIYDSSITKPKIENRTNFLLLTGFGSSNISSKPTVINVNQSITTKTWLSSSAGKPVIYNLKQIYSLRGFDASLYGKPYMIGGVKFVEPKGLAAGAYGSTLVVNTTANQDVKPKGFISLEIGSLTVSPRILYPLGFYNNGVYTNGRYETIKFGTPDVRSPVIFPDGLIHTSYGEATAWYHTRPLSPAGLSAYESGYLLIEDPTQFIYTPSLLTSAIFGDTAARNLSIIITVKSIDYDSFSDYALLTNSNRYYAPAGISSLVFGDNEIRNKTPQLFTEGIMPKGIGLPAIGYAVRYIQTTGFNRLLFGRPVLTKDPELGVVGINSLQHGVTTVWHKIRHIRPLGVDSNKYGTAVTWFRYRYLAPKSWQSSNFSDKATVTHGVRELIVNGAVRDGYGLAWVSRGTRYLEPKSIEEVKRTNHMVGGSRYLTLDGFVATLFGERIIPVVQSIQPQGLTGLWGLADARLHTRYIKPDGFISFGLQPQDRWGTPTAYNLVQYITQEFDVGNGLVPPAWSDWTAIENRNKQVNVTAFNALRFGYSQIDNNATPLLPLGIQPPAITKPMIAHAIRPIQLDGIEPPAISSWTAIHNDGRVLSPQGIIHTTAGVPTIEKNRRYYGGVGRFESLEFGEQMISYLIRTIEIEPRYSIAPPQIELPTVDLYTRYVTFRGYETVGYGIPSLSVHFNIVAPKWVYRHTVGAPALRNVTPTLYMFGKNTEELGTPALRTQWREINGIGDTLTIFGKAEIADTTRVIKPLNWRSAVMNWKHAVTQTGTNPYVLQNINLDGYGFIGSDIGRVLVNQNVLYAKGYADTRFGFATLWSNNITPIGIGVDNEPTMTTVRNKTHYINSVGGISGDNTEFGKPRMSPHTIYVTQDVTAQAIQNNGGYYIRGPATQYGYAKVDSTIRTLRARGWTLRDYGINFGRPELTLRLRIVQPNSFRLSRFGIPSIPFSLKTVELREGISETVYGRPTVSRPIVIGAQTIAPRGLLATEFTRAAIDNYTRYLDVKSFIATQVGTYLYNDKPFMWQGLRIGEHVPSKIGAGDTSLYGTAFISLIIRDITLEGFNAFRSEYDLSLFKERMTVKNKDSGLPEPRTIITQGHESSIIGYQDTKLGQHYIRPDGNSDQFRKGGYHA